MSHAASIAAAVSALSVPILATGSPAPLEATLPGACRATGRVVATSAPPAPAGSSLALTVSFGPGVTGAEQAVIWQALADWLVRFEGAGLVASPYPITFTKAPLAAAAAATDTTWDVQGILLGSSIVIDSDGSTVFFVDPTPGDDSEFTGGACSSGACASLDLLTVMRHQIGHALGFTGHFAPELNPWVANFMPGGGGTTFDPLRFEIPLDPAKTSHVDPAAFPGDLMHSVLAPGRRVGISVYPDLTAVARAFNHDVTARFVDAGSTSSGGSAFYPFLTVREANAATPAGQSAVVVPGAYDETAAGPLVLDRPVTYLVGPSGSAVLR